MQRMKRLLFFIHVRKNSNPQYFTYFKKNFNGRAFSPFFYFINKWLRYTYKLCKLVLAEALLFPLLHYQFTIVHTITSFKYQYNFLL